MARGVDPEEARREKTDFWMVVSVGLKVGRLDADHLGEPFASVIEIGFSGRFRGRCGRLACLVASPQFAFHTMVRSNLVIVRPMVLLHRSVPVRVLFARFVVQHGAQTAAVRVIRR